MRISNLGGRFPLLAETHATESAVGLEGPAANGAGHHLAWRRIVASGLFYSGALRIMQSLSRRFELHVGGPRAQISLRPVRQSKSVILCYHRVGTGGVPLFSELPPDIFAAQMLFLRRHYRMVSLDQLCDELENPRAAGQSVAITFDDGYADLFHHAFPVLEEHKIPATIFLPVASIEAALPPWYDRVFLALKVFTGDRFDIVLDRPRSFHLPSLAARIWAASKIIEFLRSVPEFRRKEYCAHIERHVALPDEELAGRMLTWEQVRAMSRAGIDFGSHSMTHPVVSQLNPEEMIHEVADSKKLLEERLGKPIRHFAFPFGKQADCSSTACQVLASCGYRSAATTIDGFNSAGQDLYGLHRVSFGDEWFLPMFAFQLGRLFLAEAPDLRSPLNWLRHSDVTRPEIAGKQKVRAGDA